MSGRDYLREKLFGLVCNLLGPAALFGYLALWSVALPNRVAVVLVWLLVAAGGYAADFHHRRRYYARLFGLLDELEPKYLIADLLTESPFLEARLLRRTLEQTGTSMLTEIGRARLSNREYQEFIETWVHQIKTPIAAARLVAENNPDPATASMAAEVDRIEKLVEQVLYYARSASVDRDCLVREVELGPVVRAALRRYARYFIEAKMTVELQQLDQTIYSDGKWLEFMLGQVFANALQYRRTDQARLTVNAEEQLGGVSLTIRDNGIGISAADLPRVFDRAFTGENGRQRGEATGMGLYLVKNLCEKLGHGVSVASQPGEFTSVTFFFPKGRLINPQESQA